jgi:hypothetical protein
MQALGFHAVIGGEHENWGTHNGLCYFGLTYLEFLGIKESRIAEKVTDNTLIQQLVAEKNNGLARLALRTRNISQAREYFRSLGLQVTGPVEGSRRQPDGTLLQWAMLFVKESESDPFKLPFIIDWKMSDQERKNALERQHLVAPHPAGRIDIADVRIAASDSKTSAAFWQKLFGAKWVTAFHDEALGAQCDRILLGEKTLTFCQPIKNNDLKQFLMTRGERPFQLVFQGTGVNKTISFHGAIYQFQP